MPEQAHLQGREAGFGLIALRERLAAKAGAEGATAPETLRQKNRRMSSETLESGAQARPPTG
jgi:hypothetical protein